MAQISLRIDSRRYAGIDRRGAGWAARSGLDAGTFVGGRDSVEYSLIAAPKGGRARNMISAGSVGGGRS